MDRFAAAAALLATGCAPCLPLDAVPIRDPTGAATFEQIAAVQAGLDEVAAWLGPESTCLRSIDFVPEEGFGEVNGVPIRGLYAAEGQYAEVSLGASVADLPSVTRHEVCHAWDAHHGYPSHAVPALAPYTYDPTHSAVRSAEEGFAVLCAAGPEWDALPLAVDRACGGPARAGGAESVTALFADRVFAGQALAWSEVVELPPSDPLVVSLDDPNAASSPTVLGGRDAVWLATDLWLDEGRGLVLQQIDPVTGAELGGWRTAVPDTFMLRDLVEVGDRSFLEEGLELRGDSWQAAEPPWAAAGFLAAADSEADETWAYRWQGFETLQIAELTALGGVRWSTELPPAAVEPSWAERGEHLLGLFRRSDGLGVLVSQPLWLQEVSSTSTRMVAGFPTVRLFDADAEAVHTTALPATLVELPSTSLDWWAPDVALLDDDRLILRGMVWQPGGGWDWPLLLLDPLTGQTDVLAGSCSLPGDLLTVGGQPLLVEQVAPRTEATLTRLGW